VVSGNEWFSIICALSLFTVQFSQCFGIVRLLIAGSPLLRYQPIIVVCILMIGFSGDWVTRCMRIAGELLVFFPRWRKPSPEITKVDSGGAMWDPD
jgi:hypothetical protein